MNYKSLKSYEMQKIDGSSKSMTKTRLDVQDTNEKHRMEENIYKPCQIVQLFVAHKFQQKNVITNIKVLVQDVNEMCVLMISKERKIIGKQEITIQIKDKHNYKKIKNKIKMKRRKG